MAQLGHLETSTGYLRIGLEPTIPTVPKNPDFRFRFGRKIRKTEKTVSARFALLRPNQGTYRHGRGTQRSGLTSGSRWCHQKSGIPDPDRARAGKLVFPFCIIVAQPGHLQMSTGYLRIGLDPRIPTVPKNPDFHFRIGQKIRKTEKNVSARFASLWPNKGTYRHGRGTVPSRKMIQISLF